MPNWSSGKSNSNLLPQYIPPGETGLVRPAPRLAARAGQPGLLPAGVPAVEDGGVVVGGAVVGGAVVGGAGDLVGLGVDDDLVGLGEGSRPGFGAVWVGEPAPPDPGDFDVLLAGRVGSRPEVGSTPTGVTGGVVLPDPPWAATGEEGSGAGWDADGKVTGVSAEPPVDEEWCM